jgi:16S rRNA C967 or C1407 C5-methylase (RsmB/RsmF family)
MRGVAVLQNLPSVAAAAALGAAPGMRVLDMCAAPGGKACAVADAMRDRGTLLALDRSGEKVAQVRAMAAQLGLTCVAAHRMDATRLLKLSPGIKAQAPAPVRDPVDT